MGNSQYYEEPKMEVLILTEEDGILTGGLLYNSSGTGDSGDIPTATSIEI